MRKDGETPSVCDGIYMESWACGDSRSNQSLPLSTPLQPILWPMSSMRTPGTTDMSCSKIMTSSNHSIPSKQSKQHQPQTAGNAVHLPQHAQATSHSRLAWHFCTSVAAASSCTQPPCAWLAWKILHQTNVQRNHTAFQKSYAVTLQALTRTFTPVKVHDRSRYPIKNNQTRVDISEN